MTAAAETAEADAMRLLTNLMPPSIVADIKAGRQPVPTLASNVVILVSDGSCVRVLVLFCLGCSSHI